MLVFLCGWCLHDISFQGGDLSHVVFVAPWFILKAALAFPASKTKKKNSKPLNPSPSIPFIQKKQIHPQKSSSSLPPLKKNPRKQNQSNKNFPQHLFPPKAGKINHEVSAIQSSPSWPLQIHPAKSVSPISQASLKAVGSNFPKVTEALRKSGSFPHQKKNVSENIRIYDVCIYIYCCS